MRVAEKLVLLKKTLEVELKSRHRSEGGFKADQATNSLMGG